MLNSGLPNPPWTEGVPRGEDVAYAAGLLDGEGTVGIYRSKRPTYFIYAVRTSVANTYRPVLEWLASKWGGSIHRTNRGEGRPCWSWALSSRSAVDFLREVLPYLRIKDRQARLALAFEAHRSAHHHMRRSEVDIRVYDSLKARISSLNKRGVDVLAERGVALI